MTKTCRVVFRPGDVGIDVAAGTTVFAAAGKAGVFLNGLCGGDGVCGRCRVIIREGRASGGGTEFFTHQEIQQGHILACEARIESDLVVEVPPETRLGEAPPYVEGEVPQLTDVASLSRHGVRLAPLVRKTYLELPQPSLENNIGDLQRLETALDAKAGGRPFQMGLKVTRRLPQTLRKAGWKVTAVTGHRGPLTEIIDVGPGDTTRLNMCIAADVGTTTVVCHLVDLCDGSTMGQAAKYNSQAAYGADVIRRIIYASQDPAGAETLRQAVVNDLNELIRELTARYRLNPHDIWLVTAAGNTTMMHLLLGLPADSIRREPYVGAAGALPPFRAAEVGLHVNPRGLMYCMPSVAGFVGGDIVAGVFATGLAHGEQVRMLIDIGTNGEIAVGCRDFIVCASASAGPAFEGAGCRSGMRATRGAIDHIRLLDVSRVLSFSTIGSAAPTGICGTGYIDLVADMLRVGVIDKTGRLIPRPLPARIVAAQHGELQYVVMAAAQTGNGKDIVVTQGDIDNILRAKAAIFAAASVMLHALNIRFSDLAEIMVAGAFGNFMNVANAKTLGLLPDLPADKLRFVGNSSLAGAKLAALCDRAYDDILGLADRMTYFELSTDPTFMDQFVSARFFPHTHVDLFPNVMAELRGARAAQ